MSITRTDGTIVFFIYFIVYKNVGLSSFAILKKDKKN